MTIFVAPTEPPSLRTLGPANFTLTEHYGADFLIPVAGGFIGVQRKTVRDLLSSLTDGRLSHDALRMTDLVYPVLLIEGYPTFTLDGLISGASGDPNGIRSNNFSKRSYWGLLLSAQEKGLFVVQSANLAETAEVLTEIETWAKKERHDAFNSRPKPSQSDVMTRRDWGIFLLQSFRGIGREVAGRIIDHFGGVPLAFTVEEKELTGVRGVGAKRARQMFELLEKVGKK